MKVSIKRCSFLLLAMLMVVLMYSGSAQALTCSGAASLSIDPSVAPPLVTGQSLFISLTVNNDSHVIPAQGGADVPAVLNAGTVITLHLACAADDVACGTPLGNTLQFVSCTPQPGFNITCAANGDNDVDVTINEDIALPPAGGTYLVDVNVTAETPVVSNSTGLFFIAGQSTNNAVTTDTADNAPNICTPEQSSNADGTTSSAFPPVPDMTINKTCQDGTCLDPTISVSVEVCNTGEEDLINISVTDPDVPNLNCPSTSLLAPVPPATSECMTCTGSYTGAVGQNTDTATATATGFVTQTAVGPISDDATCNVPALPSVTVTKTCSDATCSATGIDFTVTVCNDGPVDWTGTLTDTAGCSPSIDGAIAIAAGAPCVVRTCSVAGSAGDTLSNTASVSVQTTPECTDTASASDTCSIAQNPSVTITKTCTDETDPNATGIDFTVTVCNDGPVDWTGTLTDTACDTPISESISIAAGDPCITRSCFVEASTQECATERTVENTASVTVQTTPECTDEASASDSCTIPPCQVAICRTPGFWGTHANDVKQNSQNITQEVINECGALNVCGECISTTVPINDAASAVEAICVSPRGAQELQLARQLTAMALNCCMSGFGSDCGGDTNLSNLFSECNGICQGIPDNTLTTQECIFRIDCFNNGGVVLENEGLFCQTGTCVPAGSCGIVDDLVTVNGDSVPCNDQTSCETGFECCPLPGNCHDRELCNEEYDCDPGTEGVQACLCFEPPGPAASEKECNTAIRNGCTIFGGCGTDSCD